MQSSCKETSRSIQISNRSFSLARNGFFSSRRSSWLIENLSCVSCHKRGGADIILLNADSITDPQLGWALLQEFGLHEFGSANCCEAAALPCRVRAIIAL